MTDEPVRLDKWLWAARFFKTRVLAKKAIEGGKVHYQGERAKASRKVECHATLKIRQGWDEKTVVVTALSEQRRGAREASQLYCETQESSDKRSANAEQRKLLRTADDSRVKRPTKKQRRQIVNFKNIHDID